MTTDPNDEVFLVRAWWLEYLGCLRDPMSCSAFGLLDATKALEERGIVCLGRPMPRHGAEDLAQECDRIRGITT